MTAELKAQGERNWVEHLLTAHGRHLLSYASRFLGVAQAEEVVQETFLRLWQVATRPDEPVAWLFTVCRHLCIDRGRKDRRMHIVEPDKLARHGERAAEAVPTDSVGEQAQSVETALALMTAQQQEAVRLKFLHDRSYKEIAQIMDISVSHVGVLLHNALKRVRNSMQPTTSVAGGAL